MVLRIPPCAIHLRQVEQNLVDVSVRIGEAVGTFADESEIPLQAIGRIEITHGSAILFAGSRSDVTTRDYDAEYKDGASQYAYRFDAVLRGYIIARPLLPPGKASKWVLH